MPHTACYAWHGREYVLSRPITRFARAAAYLWVWAKYAVPPHMSCMSLVKLDYANFP